METILVCFQTCFTMILKTILVCFQISLKTSVDMVICIGLIIAILTMNLSTAILDTANLHRFVNFDFNDDFLRVRKWGFCNGILQSSLKTIRGCFQMRLKTSLGCFTMILRTGVFKNW